MIVIVVIGILAAITIVAYNGVQNRAKTANAQSLANTVAKKAEAYNAIKTGYPAAVSNFADTEESKLDDTTKVVTTLPTSANQDKVSYKTCSTGAQVIYYSLAASKTIAVGIGGQASSPSDGSGTAAALCT